MKTLIICIQYDCNLLKLFNLFIFEFVHISHDSSSVGCHASYTGLTNVMFCINDVSAICSGCSGR